MQEALLEGWHFVAWVVGEGLPQEVTLEHLEVAKQSEEQH